MKQIIIALDQGSSSTKVGAIDAQTGTLLLQSKKEISLQVKGVFCEYEPKAFLEQTITALDEVIDNFKTEEIISLGISAQRSTIALWDKLTGEILCPIISWLDGRGQEILKQNDLSQEVIHQKTGLYKTAYFSATKIKWCLDNYPKVKDSFNKGTLCCAPITTFLIWHLTKGKTFLCDPATAQRTLLFNINTFTWDDEILKSFSIPKDILPQVCESINDYGTYKNIKISASTGDQQSACAACGVLEQGRALVNYGTGAFFLLNIGHQMKEVKGVLTSLAWNRKDRAPYYLLEAPLNTAGSFLTWLKNLGITFDEKDFDTIFINAKNPIFILPALGGLGSPYFDFTLKPVMSGFLPNTTKNDIIAGALKSLILLMCDTIFYIKQQGFITESLQVAGGLSVNKNLLNFQANILNNTILHNKQKESTLMGIALITAIGLGLPYETWQELKNYESISPTLQEEKSKQIYAEWRRFFTWAINQPR